MVKIVLTPEWFIGNDVLIEAFSLIVLALIAIIAIRNYYKNKANRNILYLGLGFTLIALAQLASIFTKLVLYYDFGPISSSIQTAGQAIISSNILGSIDVFYHIGFFFQRFLTLLGLYTIYRLPRGNKSIGDYALVIYFIVLSAILSQEFYYLFHLTALVILVMIVERFYKVYREHGLINTKILVVAFGILAFSQLMFIVSAIDIFFATANIIELVGYAILLGLGIRLLKKENGKEKKPYGNYIGHAGNNSGICHIVR
jgi:hypothetical protein